MPFYLEYFQDTNSLKSVVLPVTVAMFVMCSCTFCMYRCVFWACLSRCVWGSSCWGSFSLPCCLTCASNGSWGRWKGLCSSCVKLSPLYGCKYNHPQHTDTHTYFPLLAFTQPLLGRRVHIPDSDHVLERHSQWNSQQFQLYFFFSDI